MSYSNATAGTTSPPPDHESGNGGLWQTITQKKAKKKKKKQKPVPLNEFISSSSSSHIQTELIRTSGGFRTTSPSNLLPDLSVEESLIAESLRSYFCDVLRRLGPVRVDGAKIRDEISKLETEGREVIDRFPSLSVFLTQSEDIQLFDSLVCCREHAARAKRIAVDTILNNADTTENKLKRGLSPVVSTAAVGATAVSTVSTPPPPPATNPWLNSSSNDRFLNHGAASLNTGGHNLSYKPNVPPPPPIQKPSVETSKNVTSFASSVVSGSLGGFGGIGISSSVGKRIFFCQEYYMILFSKKNKIRHSVIIVLKPSIIKLISIVRNNSIFHSIFS